MKEKTTNPKRVKGTVLFTVVSVMMVLIVFLTATLALAVTANNRAVNKLTKSQTQQTAKAAVHSIMAAMQNDATFASKINDVAAGSGITLGQDAIQFDDASLGRVSAASIEYYGNEYVLDTDNTSATYNQLVSRDILKISATATQGRESSTVTAYVLKKKNIETNDDGQNSGFVATGAAGMDNHVSSFGGTYLGFNELYKDPTQVSDMSFSVANGEAIETDMQVNGNFTVSNGTLDLVVKKPGTGMTVWGNFILNKGMNVITVNATPDSLDGLSYTQIPYVYVEKELKLNFSDNDKQFGTPGVPLNVFCGYVTTGDNEKKISANVYCYDENQTSKLNTQTIASGLYHWAANVLDSSASLESGSFYTKGSLEINAEANFSGDVVVEKDLTINGNVNISGDLKVAGSITVKGGNLNVSGTIYNDGYAGASPLYPGLTRVDGHYELKAGYTHTQETERVELLQNTNIPNPWNASQQMFVKAVVFNQDTGEVLWYEQSNDCILTLESDGQVYGQYNWGKWVVYTPGTYDVYKDASGNVVAESEANDWIPTQYYDASGNPVTVASLFPEEYEKDVILGQTLLDGKSKSETQIVKTVQEVLSNTSSNPYSAPNSVPDEHQERVTKNVISINGTGNSNNGSYTVASGGDATIITQVPGESGSFTITDSCTLSGSSFKQDLILKAKTGEEIWVVMNGFTFSNAGGQLIVDDTDSNYQGKVNVLLTGDLKFSSNGQYPIVTKKMEQLLSSTEAFSIDNGVLRDSAGNKISEVNPIKLNIYSDGAHTLHLNESGTMCANIRAPYLTVEIASGGGAAATNSAIYYNGFNTQADENSKNLGCIGCCIVKDFKSTNNWVLLYVGKKGATGGDEFKDALMNNWSVRYYENY